MQTSLPESVVHVVRDNAQKLGRKTAYVNLKNGVEEQGHLGYEELDATCRRIGAALQRRNAAGERIMLLFPQGSEFVVGFLATLFGAAIAVPAHTPKPNKRSWATFEAIVADCQPRYILTCRSIRDNIVAWSQPYPSIRALDLLCIEDLAEEHEASDWTPVWPAQKDIAFLQYTSGSTSSPKGVMVSHGNLMHNAGLTARHMGHDETTVIVSWLPLFHDLGLIGIVIQTLFVGATCYMMSPAAFSGNPALWLQAISRYRATTSMSSDFGYRLCVKSIRPEQLDGVDLSCWRNALNAAEPIYASTLRSFQDRFGPYGFSPEAFFPAYGLAEATLLSTTSRVGEPPVLLSVNKEALAAGRLKPVGQEGNAVELVSSGRPASDMEIAIVNPDTHLRCKDAEIGEVWVSGDSITTGYWQAPAASAATFGQSPAGEDNPHFMRTGDLGFLQDGELYIAGRLKDIIIMRGRNIYPQDIELTVKDCHPAFRTVNGVAFAIDGDDGETIAVVHEIERTARHTTDLGELERVVRDAVWRNHDVTLSDIIFIPPASLPKTTSGKVQRRLTRDLYLAGQIKPLPNKKGRCEETHQAAGHAKSASEIEAGLMQQLRALLGDQAGRFSAEDSFGAIGIDSVLAARFVTALNADLDLALDPTIVWEYSTPALLARHLSASGTNHIAPLKTPDGSARQDMVQALKNALGGEIRERQSEAE